MEEDEDDQARRGGDRQDLDDNRGQLLREVTVPTKNHDGGGGAARVPTENGAEGQGGTAARPDAFALLSNQNVRMTHLLGLDSNGDAQADNVQWQAITGYQNLRRPRQGLEADENERRTRLSTELYPDVFHNVPPPDDGAEEEDE